MHWTIMLFFSPELMFPFSEKFIGVRVIHTCLTRVMNKLQQGDNVPTDPIPEIFRYHYFVTHSYKNMNRFIQGTCRRLQWIRWQKTEALCSVNACEAFQLSTVLKFHIRIDTVQVTFSLWYTYLLFDVSDRSLHIIQFKLLSMQEAAIRLWIVCLGC